MSNPPLTVITLSTAAMKPTISSAVACLNGWLYWLSKPNSSIELNRVPMLAASPRLYYNLIIIIYRIVL